MMLNLADAHATQVISGGQTGVDIAALRAASLLGFRTGGYAPKGFRTQVGSRSSLAKFGLHEHNGGYAARTHANIIASHATVVIASKLDSAGTKLTLDGLVRFSKPHFVLELRGGSGSFQLARPEALREASKWVYEQAALAVSQDGGFILNVAGNSSQTSPGIFVPGLSITMQLLAHMLSEATSDSDATSGAKLAEAMGMMGWSSPQQALRLQDIYDIIPELAPRHREVNLVV